MNSIKPAAVSEIRFLVPTPSNDNLLAHVRPLTAAEVTAILDEHGRDIGAAIDAVAQEGNLADNPYRTFTAVLLRLPELQRWIVWHGSNLKRQDVDQLQESALVMACAEVIGTTKAEYTDSVLQFLIEGLREFSDYVASGDTHG